MPSRMIYLKNVASLRLDPDRCTGCGLCMIVCPHGVFERSKDIAVIATSDACMECGACAQNCPAEAISVRAGVGCAAAVINGMLGRSSTSCCCVVDAKSRSCDVQAPDPGVDPTGCC